MKELLHTLGDFKLPDFTLLSKIAEFIIFIVGTVGIGLFKSRTDASRRADDNASRARAEEEASRQQVIANFTALINTWKERVDELSTRLNASNAALDGERTEHAKQLILFRAFIRRYLTRNPNDALESEDIELLNNLGVEVIQITRATKGADKGVTQP